MLETIFQIIAYALLTVAFAGLIIWCIEHWNG